MSRRSVVVAGVLLVLALALLLLRPAGNGSAILRDDAGETTVSSRPPAGPAAGGPDGSAAAPVLEDPSEEDAVDQEAWFLRVVTDPPGATVTARFEFAGGEPDPPSVSKVTDADGFAGFAIPGGRALLRWIRVAARAPGRGCREARLRGDDPQEVRLVLNSLAVRGQVLGFDGRPLEGAGVHAGVPVRTGADGEFEVFTGNFDVSGGKEPLRLVVLHPGHLPKEVEVPATTLDLVVRMERGREVWGRVTFPDGRPVPGVALEARGPPWFVRTTTGDDGAFVLSGLPEGPVRVVCAVAGEERKVQAGATGVDFVLKDHLVRVLVRDGEGRPFREANLYLSVFARDGADLPGGGARTSGRDGMDQVRVLMGGHLRVTPAVPGWSREPVEFAPEGEPRLHDLPVSLRPLGPDGALALRALDGDGRPLRRVYLTLPAFPGERFDEREVLLDADGRGTLEGVPAGVGVFTAAASPCWLPSEETSVPVRVEIRVDPGATVPVELTIPTGGRVRVTVLAPDRSPATPAGGVRLKDPSGRALPVSFFGLRNGSLASAHFCTGPALSHPAVPPGRYLLEVTPAPGRHPISRDVVVPRGGVAEVEIVLER